ncbi:hypothetical protein WJX81_008650 [Elliptochloris bilobata]|uniref:Alpha/beta hydrolase fold-3 domain-containing protein n=1 Tax=Elliptochloris bilobata TaxID=381761 RepID=A0AAW1R1F7_9CHLO
MRALPSSPTEQDHYLEPLRQKSGMSEPALLAIVNPLTIAPSMYRPLALAVQERVNVDLAVVLVQASWAAALAEPSAFLATARRVLEEDLARVRAEATKRGWLGPCLPSGRNERLFLAGHSAGGQISADYAQRLAGGLILLACALSREL